MPGEEILIEIPSLSIVLPSSKTYTLSCKLSTAYLLPDGFLLV
jgi:hypothetical protein